MHKTISRILLLLSPLLLAGVANAQVDDICNEFGATPSLNSPFANIPYVFGRVSLKGVDPSAKFPKITVTLFDPQQTQRRLTIERSGNYCFRKTAGAGGTLVVEVDGVEVARRSLSTFGPTQQREDFEIHQSGSVPIAQPAVVSTKFTHPRNEKTVELYSKASEAEQSKKPENAIRYLKEIVAIDPADFISWAKLGSLYFEGRSYVEAEAAVRKSIALRPDYTPAWIYAGKLRSAQKQFEAAAEVFKHAVSIDPGSARAFQLLGETYLQLKQGSLGADALKKAIELDPMGMAECHLLLARLYDLAGAKDLAAKEFKAFLSKVSDHPDKTKFEKYIKEHP